MTEVQSTAFNPDYIEALSKGIFIAYVNFEKKERIEEITYIKGSTAPLNDKDESIFKKFLTNIYEIIKKIIDSLRDLYIEVLPILFDNFIQYILKNLRNTNKSITFTFKQFYEIFQLFGLEEINAITFNRVTAALQWKICSQDWIDLEFVISYKDSLFSNASPETLEALEDLCVMLINLKKEEEGNKNFIEDLEKILED